MHSVKKNINFLTGSVCLFNDINTQLNVFPIRVYYFILNLYVYVCRAFRDMLGFSYSVECDWLFCSIFYE